MMKIRMKTTMQLHAKLSQKQQGFTLIELMIVVIVMGILSAFAFPAFMDSVRKSNRADATQALTRATANQERFFAASGTYTADVTDLGLPADGASEQGLYTISLAAGATGIGSSYVVTATAVPGLRQAEDTGCTVFSISSLGVQTPNPASSRCW
jgi:type IV pilus assembly protein PilE